MNLLDILESQNIRVPLQATDKKGVIDELVDLLASHGHVTDADGLKSAVWTRETIRTTGIGHALAIPHGKSDAVSELVMAIGKPSEPIDFASIDGKPVKLVVLLASPLERTSDHIQALARISRLMASEEFREGVYKAESAEAVYDLFATQEAATTA
jgi:fructose-specific phosphotransferase system IIA component